MEVYLITGGAGFIGSHFIEYLLSTGRELKIVNINKLTSACSVRKPPAVSQMPTSSFRQPDSSLRRGMKPRFAHARP